MTELTALSSDREDEGCLYVLLSTGKSQLYRPFISYTVYLKAEDLSQWSLLPEHEQHTVNHGEALWVSKFD